MRHAFHLTFLASLLFLPACGRSQPPKTTSDETQVGKAALIVTELANNVVKHGGGGEILIRNLSGDEAAGLEFLALDRGPGMDLARCRKDGFSTGGTPGTGIGAVERLSSVCEIYTSPAGTAVLCQIWPSDAPALRTSQQFELGAINEAVTGEPVSGDSWAAACSNKHCLFLIADGLGHGALAAAASREAVRIVHQNAEYSPSEILPTIHAALRSSRGAAVGLAAFAVSIDLGPREKIVDRELHVTLTGWNRNTADYVVLRSKPDIVVLQMANPDVTDLAMQGWTSLWRSFQQPQTERRDTVREARALFDDPAGWTATLGGFAILAGADAAASQ